MSAAALHVRLGPGDVSELGLQRLQVFVVRLMDLRGQGEKKEQ